MVPKLVFGTRQDAETGLRVRDLATGEEKWLKYPVQRDDQESSATRDVLPGYRLHARLEGHHRFLRRKNPSRPDLDR